MNLEEINDLFLLSDYLAVIVHYHNNNNICFKIITRNPRFFKGKNKTNFYDFVHKKEIYLDIKEIEAFYMQFADKIKIGEIRKKIFNPGCVELEEHLEYNIKFADMFNNIMSKEVRNITKITKNMTEDDLRIECSENLFFTPISSTREKIIAEMKARKKFLLQTIDGGVVEKITSIFNIKDDEILSSDVKIINKCKANWKKCILFYCDKAKKMLEEERKGDWNSEDLLIEISEIHNMLDLVVKEFEEKQFLSPKEVASYWPDILKPAPIYVVQ
jgi:hypothetical protein